MPITSTTAALHNSASPAPGDLCDPQHGSVNAPQQAPLPRHFRQGHGPPSTPLADAQDRVIAEESSPGPLAHAGGEAFAGSVLNPHAPVFQPGAANKQRGLLATPPQEGAVTSGPGGVQSALQQKATSGARRRNGDPVVASYGRRPANTRPTNGPPRVMGWEGPSLPPHNLVAQGRVPAAVMPAGLSAAFQGHLSPSSSSPNRPGGSEHTGAGQASARRGQAVNANFLLNFKYEEHKRQAPARNPLPRRRREKLKPYNKELFLQANFRFLVSDLSEYSANVRDPDRMLDWEDVAAVEVLAPTPLQCPICLEEPPCCPQITLCGHIFCFPCLLRYLSQGETLAADYKGDGPWKKCPLCFTLISPKDLRTVNIRSVPSYKPGDAIHFTLLARAKGSIIPFERTEAGRVINPSPSALCYSDSGQCALFAKFTLTSSIDSVTSTATQALTALADRTADSLLDDQDALPFIYGAIDQLHARAQAWADHRSTAFLTSSPPVRQRILAQTARKDHSGLEKIPPLLSKEAAAFSAPGSEAAASKEGAAAEKEASGEPDIGSAEFKQRGWVYEDAFSDAGSEESVEARSVEGRKESALRTIEEGLASRRGAPSEEDDGSATESGSDQDGAMGVFAPDEKKKRNKRLAKVPEDKAGGGSKATEGEERAWYCFYQSSDGQSVFLHPLSMKCLLQHYGSYEALPPSMEARLVEAESVTMASEGTRKKYAYLSHLSLTGAFVLAEVDLRPLLPPSAFAPFQEEVVARERRRARMQKQEQEHAARQARVAAAAVASAQKRSRPPAPEDFAALLSAVEEAELEQALAISVGDPLQGASPPASSPSPTVPIAFSQVTKMGYASAYDAPALHGGPSAAPPSTSASPPATRWGASVGPKLGGEPVSFAAKLQAEKKKERESAAQQTGEAQVGSKKNKKGAKMLLSTGSARKY